MSRNWAGGSTPRWRRVRAEVLALNAVRNAGRCTLQLEGCTGTATQAHHVLGRSVSGDDPRYIVAACARCNQRTGDPTRLPDPPHRPRVWS